MSLVQRVVTAMNPRYLQEKIWHVDEVYVTDDITGIWTDDDLSTDLMCAEDNRQKLLAQNSQHSQPSRYKLLIYYS